MKSRIPEATRLARIIANASILDEIRKKPRRLVSPTSTDVVIVFDDTRVVITSIVTGGESRYRLLIKASRLMEIFFAQDNSVSLLLHLEV